MLFLAAVAMVLASDTFRSSLEEVFAHASIFVADHFVLFMVTISIAATVFFSTFYMKPVSYPGDARTPTERHPKWTAFASREMDDSDTNWVLSTSDNTSSTGADVIGYSIGRQVWRLKDDKSEKRMAHTPVTAFNPSKNPNASDQLYRSSKVQSVDETATGTPRLAENVDDVLGSCRQAISFYQQLQSDSGYWPGDYGGPMFLLPGMVIMSYVTGTDLGSSVKNGMIKYLRNHQQADGGWGTHIEGASTMFATVLSYVSLRMLGAGHGDRSAVSARTFILKNGGAIRTPSWGKFWLACAGLYDWAGCNPVPPELWLLPRWFPFHPGKLWCHCRMVYLPMSYLYGMRFSPNISPLLRDLRSELYTEPYDTINWEKARGVEVSELDLYSAPTKLMRFLNDVLALYEKRPFMWLRRKALQFAIEYIYTEDRQTNYICIGPVNKTLNMLSVFAHSNGGGKEFEMHIERLADYLWVAEDGVKMQGYNGSQMWDTSFACQAILDTGLVAEFKDCLGRAFQFMDKTQIRENEKDHEKWFRHISKGGWPFSTNAHGWPISDCTAEGLKATLRIQEHEALVLADGQKMLAGRFYDAVNVILSLQNYDGGWATYECNRGYGWYEWLNPSEVFGDIMIDYSYVECSSACISALSTFVKHHPTHRSDEILRSMKAGSNFIKSIQRPDGSWYGSWGVCFTYGTWFGIEGLLSAGESPRCKEIQRACDFLLSKQRVDGSWSESYLSCVDKLYTEHPTGGQVVQTAWALLGLLKGECESHTAIQRGIQYLLDHQLPNGDFAQEGICGVFNRNCGITYTAYRNIFPIWALGVYFRKCTE